MRKGRVALAILGAATAGLLATAAILDAAFPPDLSRYHTRAVTVTDRHGKPLRIFPTADGTLRMAASPAEADPTYLTLLLAFEDKRFGLHPGVDPLAVGRAAFQNITAGRIVSGASTLTMQVARLLEPRPRTYRAKLIEAARAVQLAWHFDQDELLGMYLTLAPMGGNLEGVRAATLAYFGKEPRQLTLAETALLIALPQAPTSRRPDLHPEAARAGVRHVLNRLAAQGAITEAAATEALDDALPTRRLPLPFQAPHLAQTLADPPPADGLVTSTIDAGLQGRLEDLARREASQLEAGATVALLVVENDNRKVRAAIGQADFFAPGGQVDMIRAQRSPGSTLKPFVYGLGFEHLALHPDTALIDRALQFGDYAPRNFDRQFHGATTVRQALLGSFNLPAVQVLDRIGPERLAGAFALAGARITSARSTGPASLPLALGGVGISLADLTMLYAAIPSRGQVLPLVWREDTASLPPIRLMSEAAAWYLTDILADAPPPVGIGRAGGEQRRIGYKTGTSYGFRDALAVGFSGSHTVAVWVGRPDGTPRPGIFARTAAAPLLFKGFDRIEGNRPLIVSTPPEGALPRGRRQELPAGLSQLDTRRTTPRKALTVAYPPHGAEVYLDPDGIALVPGGGQAPYRWYVDEKPVTEAWKPEEVGFAKVTVIDAEGGTATATVRLKDRP
ncbi:penicillin-binding protein 1C [Lacibacterium aquatile]|uniref:peptidoglycan glycosyltransferase n=1 Tax=Lacibacterium aquatile TaxID=1168082 RepID=A0ABW5DWS3_9PROT